MEAVKNLIDPLLEKAEVYGKTSFELLKLKALDKTADISANLFSRFLFILVISFFAIFLNVAIALWLGDLLGKIYYGFFIVAAFYGVISIILLITHPHIKARLNNVIIKELFN